MTEAERLAFMQNRMAQLVAERNTLRPGTKAFAKVVVQINTLRAEIRYTANNL
jgi:hypothetical protein